MQIPQVCRGSSCSLQQSRGGGGVQHTQERLVLQQIRIRCSLEAILAYKLLLCLVCRQEGYRVILLNSNPVSGHPSTAQHSRVPRFSRCRLHDVLPPNHSVTAAALLNACFGVRPHTPLRHERHNSAVVTIAGWTKTWVRSQQWVMQPCDPAVTDIQQQCHPSCTLAAAFFECHAS